MEDIRDHMEAMLAYPLKDMDFESEAGEYGGRGGKLVCVHERAEYRICP
ncbi:hypothetical protein ACFSQ7_33595 [Paenibacillus rhizoplanae]